MDGMRFERELKSHAEPVSAAELKEGAIYFFVNFVDDKLLVPTMRTVVFVGRNFEPDEQGRVYFQDIDSYREGIRWETMRDDACAEFLNGSEAELGHVFEYEHALDVLIACSLRTRCDTRPSLRR